MSFVRMISPEFGAAQGIFRRHSRESGKRFTTAKAGNPICFVRASKMDSRFRGNDVAVGMVRVVSGVAV